MFKYLKVFQGNNGSDFKNKVAKLLEKQSVDIRRARTKYKRTRETFEEAFKKELRKLLLKPMGAQELQGQEKVSTICVKNFNKIVNKRNNTKSSMSDMTPKYAIKLNIVSLDKT